MNDLNRRIRLLVLAIAVFALCLLLPSAAHAAPSTIPGESAPLPFSVTDTLDLNAGHVNAVYSFAMQAGQTVQLNMTGDSGTDFALLLYRPGSSAVGTMTGLVAASDVSGSSTETITYIALQNGTYYIDVQMQRGSLIKGAFQLNGVLGPLQQYAIAKPSAPLRVKHGKKFNLITYLSPRYDLGGKPVTFVLYLRQKNGKYKKRLTAAAGMISQGTKTGYAVNGWLSKGKWMAKAYFTDDLHPTKEYSGAKYITIY